MVNSNHDGGTVMLTNTLVPLDNTVKGYRHLSVRSASNNATVYFGIDEQTVTGFLEAGESKDFWNIRPDHIYIKGTSGELVYWDGDIV